MFKFDNNDVIKKPKPFFNLNPHAYSTQMKEYNQWIFSQLKKNPDGTWSKPPCNASGYYTDGTDDNNWLSFEKAFEICKANPDKFFGIGFSVSSACPIRAMDFDHVFDPVTGKWNQQAWQELMSLNITRVEWSPSHTGVHVFFTCPFELESGNKTQPDGTKREIYFEKHYLTVTGEVVEGFPETINKVDPELITKLYDKWFPGKRIAGKAEAVGNDNCPPPVKAKLDNSTFEMPVVPINDPNDPLQDPLLNFTDDGLIKDCLNAPNGWKFKLLFEKKNSWEEAGYGSESGADLGFCNMLAFHTNNYNQIRRVVKRSALWDDKWERKNESYARSTIGRAIRDSRWS